ncbi:MAG: hypothetical protein KIT17_07765 [Rubrivivax sp.]|nr:hypothetical protein [Rubrivivax sp.]
MKQSSTRAGRRRALSSLGSVAALGGLAPFGSDAARAQAAQAAPAASRPAGPALPAFAVEIRTGPGWDANKPPQAQAQFREHSAHLRRLRDEGHLLLGARYGDKGLLVVAAADLAAVHRLLDGDPSMQAGTFVYEAHPMAVFHGGCVQPPPRRG